MREPRGRLLALATTALVHVTAARAAELVQGPQRNVTITGAVAAGPAALPPAEDAMPDERPLWRLLSAGDYPTLLGRVARLRQLYPAWQPPTEMQVLMARDAQERDLAAAKAQRDWPAVRRLTSSDPTLATCARPDDAAIAAAAPGEPSTLVTVYDGCADDAARAALLAVVLDRFGAAAIAPVSQKRGEATLPDPVRRRLEAARTDEAFSRLGQALATGAPDAINQGAALRPAIEARGDGGTAMALGWASLKAGNPNLAVTWFALGRRLDPEQSPEGLARAYSALGQGDAARQALAEAPGPGATALAIQIEQTQIDAAYRRGAYTDVVTRAAALPDPPILLGWSLFRLGRFDNAAAAFERRYRAHREPAAATGLVASLLKARKPEAAAAAADRLGGAVRAALRPGSGPRDVAPADQAATDRLRVALARHDNATALSLGDKLADPVITRQDVGLVIALGWAAFEQEDFAAASRWFTLATKSTSVTSRDEAEFGVALTGFRKGDAAIAEAAAAAHPQTGRWGQLRLDALMLRANQANEANPDDPEALAAARTALHLDPTRRDAAMLLAWSDLRAGHSADAATMFERLYRAKPDEAAAAGLVDAQADPATLRELAGSPGGPLAGIIRQRAAYGAFGRKAFLAALHTDPRLSPALANLDAPQFGLSATYRDKSGGEGTSRLSSTTEDITASLVRGTDRYTIRLHALELSAGTAPIPPAGAVARMTTRLTGVEPVVSWERETSAAPLLAPFAELGLTPLGGVVGPTVQGQVGAAYQGSGFNLRGAGYRQSITESILSFSGIRYPATGRSFGRVTETGGRLEGYLQVLPDWGVYVQGSAGVRDGMGVQSNRHGSAAATLSYAFQVKSLDYLTLGPSYQFSAFRHDLSGFTPGQGGYYSPSQSHTAGAAFRMQTSEARDAVLRASLFTGWQFARSDGAVDGHGGRLVASRQDGFNSTGEVVAAYRVSPHWVAGGMVRYQVSPQFTDLYAGLSLTFSLGDRLSLLSADLPRFDVR